MLVLRKMKSFFSTNKASNSKNLSKQSTEYKSYANESSSNNSKFDHLDKSFEKSPDPGTPEVKQPVLISNQSEKSHEAEQTSRTRTKTPNTQSTPVVTVELFKPGNDSPNETNRAHFQSQIKSVERLSESESTRVSNISARGEDSVEINGDDQKETNDMDRPSQPESTETSICRSR